MTERQEFKELLQSARSDAGQQNVSDGYSSGEIGQPK